MGEWVKGGLLALGCQWREEHANAFSQPHALAVLWAQVPIEIASGCDIMLSESVRLLRLSTLRCSAGWGEMCFIS
jgi:hypothetical protein